MTTTTYEIQSLSPAPGWFCVSFPDGGDVEIQPLVGWAICKTALCDDNGVQRVAGEIKWDEFKVTTPAILFGDEVRACADLFAPDPWETGPAGWATPFRVVLESEIEQAKVAVTAELQRMRRLLGSQKYPTQEAVA